MPLLDFECVDGHIFEKFIKLSEYKPKMPEPCPICTKWAKRTFITHRQARNAQAFQPSVFFERDGELFVGGTNDPADLKGVDKKLLKQGYKKIEITNFRQYEQFQKSHGAMLEAKHAEELEIRKQLYSSEMQKNIDDIKAGYTWDKPQFDSQGNLTGYEPVAIPPLHRLHPEVRAIAEEAIKEMRRTDNMDMFKQKSQRPFIEAFEQDRPMTEDESGRKKWY